MNAFWFADFLKFEMLHNVAVYLCIILICVCFCRVGHVWREDKEVDWIGLDLFNDDTHPSGHISHPTQVNVSQSCFNSLNKLLKLNYIVQDWRLVEVNCVISDRRIQLLTGILLCTSRELSRRGYAMSQLCSIRHNIPVPLHTPGAYDQCWVFDHSGDKQWVVLGTRYGAWWPWYGQFEVGWLQPLQLWLSAGISLVAPMLLSRGRDLCHVQPHPTWFEPTAECRS